MEQKNPLQMILHWKVRMPVTSLIYLLSFVAQRCSARSQLAFYNAGSAIAVLLLIALGFGIYFYIRRRRERPGKPKGSVALARDEEEAIPLSQSVGGENDGRYSPIGDRSGKVDKGKARALNGGEPEPHRQPIFDVGDSDDEEDKRR